MEKEYFIRALEQIRSVVDIKITTLGKLDNGIVQGNIQFRNENILVEFDTEKEAPLMADFNILAQQLKNYFLILMKIIMKVLSMIYLAKQFMIYTNN